MLARRAPRPVRAGPDRRAASLRHGETDLRSADLLRRHRAVPRLRRGRRSGALPSRRRTTGSWSWPTSRARPRRPSAGRYKDVNLIGAACITATLNATRGLDLPYVFGGDGATVLIPPERREAWSRTRCCAPGGSRRAASASSSGSASCRSRSCSAAARRVLVAKYQLSPGNHLAMFAGGGIALADRLIKDGAGFGLDDDGDPGPPDLDGPVLPLAALPVAARPDADACWSAPSTADDLALQREIIARLGEILGAGADAARPVQRANMRFVWPPKGLRAEALLTHGRRPRWLRRLVPAARELAAADRRALRSQDRPPTTRRPTARSCGATRTTARSPTACTWCSTAPRPRSRRSRPISPGCTPRARSSTAPTGPTRAMMTCLVFSLEQSRHVHFIDGADGGYALAALQLKAQLQALVAPRPDDAGASAWNRATKARKKQPADLLRPSNRWELPRSESFG